MFEKAIALDATYATALPIEQNQIFAGWRSPSNDSEYIEEEQALAHPFTSPPPP
jgi:hypothetical protein